MCIILILYMFTVPLSMIPINKWSWAEVIFWDAFQLQVTLPKFPVVDIMSLS